MPKKVTRGKGGCTNFNMSLISRTDLQDASTTLDMRVTVLEENIVTDDNCSVTEIEVRVEALEETTADQETRLVVAEENIECKQHSKRCTYAKLFTEVLSNAVLSS